MKKLIYRNECLICHKRLSGSLDYETHLKLSHDSLYEKIEKFIIYKSKYGTTVICKLAE